MKPRGMAATTSTVFAIFLLVAGCGPSKQEHQAQIGAKQAELDAKQTDLTKCLEKLAELQRPPLPPSPIDVEPGGGGNLRWTQDGADLAPGGSLTIRDDFSWKADYLKVKLADGSWPEADWVKFKVTSGSNTGTAQIWASGGVFQWHFANNPLGLCDHLPDGDPNQDPELAECPGGGIASELYGTLNGSISAKLSGGGVVNVQAARFAPR